MKEFGIFLIIVGMIWGIVALIMQTDVDSGSLQVHNIGLLQQQSNHFIIASTLFLSGVILFGCGAVTEKNNSITRYIELLSERVDDGNETISSVSKIREPQTAFSPKGNTNEYLDAESMAIQLKKMKILDHAGNSNFQLTSGTWDFIIQNQIHEIAPMILRKLSVFLSSGNQFNDQGFMSLSKKYFLSLESRYISKYLMNYLIKQKLPSAFLLDIIKCGGFIELDEIIKILESNNFLAKKFALQILKFHKSYYTKNDIVSYYRIAELVKSMNTKAKELENGKWYCICGKKNSRRSDRCAKCTCDKFGFAPEEVTPMEILEELRNRVHILKNHFQISNL